MSGADDHPGLGVELPPLTVRFTRETLVRYAGASTDFNPIHYSEHFATSLGLPDVVAHGMLTMGVALRVVTDWVGDASLVQSWFTRFAKPIIVPDGPDGTEVQLTGRVSALSDPDDDGDRVATVAVEAICADERVLRGAVAEVRLPAALTASWRWTS